MATIYIDGKPYEVKPGGNLLSACLGLGFNLPYFCWHPAMHSVGACRQCAVKEFKDGDDRKGSIVMACMTPVRDGMYISIDDPEARHFRASVIEWLMTNHPHDCPVCDEGGECHLQDMTVMTGHSYRRFRGKKRTHVSQYLGPFLTHEMNRCIACYRCTRFYNDYAGGRDFGAFASHNYVFFGRSRPGTLESPFAGNLAEVCPTGVFDDKSFERHYTRKWDLQTAPSVCVHCGLGCNTIPGERYGTLRRIRNRYNGEVNGYFLCDRGRYGYEFVNSDRRVTAPRSRRERSSPLAPVSADEAVRLVSGMVASGRSVVGIGSPRASIEANFALRTLVGPERFYAGIGPDELALARLAVDIMGKGGAAVQTLSGAGRCDAVLVLGEDIANTAPILHLQVLQSIRQKSIAAAESLKIPYWDDTAVRVAGGPVEGPLFVATSGPTALDGRATGSFRAPPSGIARIGFAVANLIDNAAPGVSDLGKSASAFAASCASALSSAERPLVISGPGSRDGKLMEAAANVAWALRKKGRQASLFFTAAECNTLGLALMTGKGLDEAWRDGKSGLAIILENDLYTRMEADDARRMLDSFGAVVVIDHLYTRTALGADVVLPAATFAEATGTLVNSEGRAQRFFQVFPARDEVRPAWRWLSDLISARAKDLAGWADLDALITDMARELPRLAPCVSAAPSASFREVGMRIARQSARYSGRTAMTADRSVRERKPPPDPDSPLTFSMEGYEGVPPSSLVARFWAPGWNSPQAVNRFQEEIGGPLSGGDPGVRLFAEADGTAPYFGHPPGPVAPEQGLFLVVPLYHVFGSEELSVFSPGVRELSPEPYVALGERDMARLDLSEGDAVALSAGGRSYRLKLRQADMAPGVAGVASGVPNAPVLAFPLWAKIERAR